VSDDYKLNEVFRVEPHKQAEDNPPDLDCIHVQNGIVEVIRGDDDDHVA
jgi:hypothetical protein